jgi:hypothetical protein
MELFLTILGSVASIGSVPLTIYLYIRGREARYEKAKLEIVRLLSFHIGQGRPITPFEIEAVIESKARDGRLRRGAITQHEIVQDLVTEIISNPLLHGEMKSEIITSLAGLEGEGTKALADEAAKSELDTVEADGPRASTLFGAVAALASIVAVGLQAFSGPAIMRWGSEPIPLDRLLFEIMLGFAAAALSGAVTRLALTWARRRRAKLLRELLSEVRTDPR